MCSSDLQIWFNSLPENSIKDIKDLEKKFLLNFATSRKQLKTEFQLDQVRQAPGETLQKYLQRFKDMALQVPGLKEDVHLHCVTAGLDKDSRLKKSVVKRRLKTLAEFRDHCK